MKHLLRAIVAALLLVGFAGVFQIGKSIGFKTGSEWALVQADILAREEGLFMPVYMDDDNFRLVIKQPRGIYKKAWQLADQYDETKNDLKMANLDVVPDEQSKQVTAQTNF